MQLYGSGPRLDEPQGDATRQAVASLRGYAYQLYVSALAWLGVDDGEALYLEVAEDYAIAASGALEGVQVKDTIGSVTLRSEGVRTAIDAYVDLVSRNPNRRVSLRYLTTSQIGLEQRKDHQIEDGPALLYWRRAATGADIKPLRERVADLDLAPKTKAYLGTLTDEGFREIVLQRIHWDCGAPGLLEVREDLEAGLIEYVASARRLSSHAARGLTPTVVEKVLLTTVSTGSRVLRRADLLGLIDAAAMVAVPIEQLAAAFQGIGAQSAQVQPRLLNPVNDNLMPAIYAQRDGLVAKIDEARRTCGLAIAHGATGLGKTLAARLAAARSEAIWAIADLRHLSVAETAARLGHIQAELTASPGTHVILDDLNDIDEPAIRDALARLLTALRRRDGTAIITTYRCPAKTTLHQLANVPAEPIEVPYLDETEVEMLVVGSGGESKYAGSVYRAAAKGHPQLTMATLLHLQASSWGRRSIAALLGGAMHSELGTERRATRQRLVNAMEPDAQTLLLRVSLIIAGFDRPLALRIAALDPSVARGGLVLDRLIGPWIEPYFRDRLRVSPLLEDAAADVLSAEECRTVHRCVAEALMEDGTVEPLDASALLHHALRSEVGSLVAGFAHSVIATDANTLERLAPFFAALAAQQTDTLLFPQDPAASAILRLAQLLVLLPRGDAEDVRACWDALERERPNVKGQDLFESMVLSKILLQSRTGLVFETWIEFVLRFDQLCLSNPMLHASARDYGSGNAPHATGVMFSSQMRHITAVVQFRALLERLDREDSETRARVFATFRPDRADISVLVNHAWMKESRTEGFDWEAAQEDYGATAEIALRWGDRVLASRCYIAQSICIDENGGESERALAALAAAQDRLGPGPDMALSRARAKIFWRARDHAAALPLLEAAAKAGGQSPLEQAYIAREAGISAANLGDWSAAQGWFDRAQRTAMKASAIPTVRAMAIGLLADTGHAAWQAGRPAVAIGKMREALLALPTIDQDGTLAEAYCHRVVRHGLLWLYNAVTGRTPGFDEEVVYGPGAASNPEPREEIRSHPVVALDISFYFLADIDRQMSKPTGYHLEFRKDLFAGPILSSEASEAIYQDHQAILAHDPSDFVRRLRRQGTLAGLMEAGELKRIASDIINPQRGELALSVIDTNALPAVHRGAEDYLLSFTTAAAMARAFNVIDDVVAQGLAAPEVAELHPLLERIGGKILPLTSDREGAANTLWRLRQDATMSPEELCWSAIWLLLHVEHSQLRDGVEIPLLNWIFAAVDHLVRHARFRLTTPQITVGPLEALLNAPVRDRAAAAHLLIAFAPAASARIPPKVRERLDIVAGNRPRP